MEVSEEQKRRIDANRAAALARRNAKVQCLGSGEPLSNCVRLPMQHRSLSPQSDVFAPKWNHTAAKASTDCRQQGSLSRGVKLSVNKENHALSHSVSGSHFTAPRVAPHCGGFGLLKAPEKNLLNSSGTGGEVVKVGVEICAPDRFSLVVKSGRAFQDFWECVSRVSGCENLEPLAQCPVYNLKDYDEVTEVLKGLPGVEYERIPWPTRMVLEKFQRAAECGVPYGPDHITDFEVDQLLLNLPQKLAKTLLPFQREGVKYGLQRGGRFLLADEMGVGKTIQAIAVASCYREEGSLLVICPASLRLVWAEELERWLPYLSPLDVHLVFGRKNNLTENMPLPKVVVISFNMMARLRESMSSRKWGMVIVDEAHNLRCTSKRLECHETMAVLELVQKVNRVVLLTGTPSLSRPFDIFNQVNCLWPKLLGKSKYEFAQNYCDRQSPSSGQGDCRDFSKGARLLELNVLLKQTVMIRRMKDDVMMQLPPKRRQMICLQLSTADIQRAKAFTDATSRERTSVQLGEEACKCGFTRKGACDCEDENEEESSDEGVGVKETASKTSARLLTEQEIGVAKLGGFQEWLLNNSIFANRDGTSQKKMIIFAHHLKVLDSIQTIIESKNVAFVRIDGSTLPRDRLNIVNRFRSDPEVKLAIIGVQAGGVGLDFSAAGSVTFVELPKSASEMLQAEDRAHRRGQKNSVNIYVFVAKGTGDVKRWQSLSKSLERVSTMTDGTEASLEIERVVDSSNIHLQGTFSQDSCITTETINGSLNLADQALAYSTQLRLSATQCTKNTPGGSAETNVDFPATSLMFEVSSNTGRIHLSVKSDGENAGPTSLQANFKPDDLTQFAESGICARGALPDCLQHNASHRQVAALFWEEYCKLRPFFRRRLRGRPLSLPLSAELESLNDEDQYVPGGLVKGGSKRRWTPKEEVGCGIPAGSSWRTISYRRRKDLKERQIAQAWTADNIPLCKYCQQPCKRPRSVKPESFEDFFCQIKCLNDYSSKTNGRHIREELFDLEGGVCVKCRLDCHALVDRIKPLPLELRREYILKNASQLTESKTMFERLIKNPSEGNAWHADHILAVADGGGECTLENFQTLCISCHSKVTAEQHRRRTFEKLQLKKSLQRTIKKLQEQTDRKKRRRTIDVEGDSGVDYMDTSEDEDDQDLLNIKVAGSAYSTSPVTEVLTDHHAYNSILQPPRTKDCQFIHNASSPEVEALAVRSCQPILQAPSEDDQDLLNIQVAGSSYSTFGMAEVRSEDACKSILQPSSAEGRESTPEVKVLALHACKSILRASSEDVEDILSIQVAGSSYSDSGIVRIAEKLSESACNSALQPSSPEGRESAQAASSLSGVKSGGEVFASLARKSILRAPTEDDRDLLKFEVAGSSFSASGVFGVTEELSEGAGKQLSSPEGRESAHIANSPEFEVLALRACKSILRATSEDAEDVLNIEVTRNSCSNPTIIVTKEELSGGACKSMTLQPSSPDCRESTHIARSFEAEGSTEVLLGDNACKLTLHTSARDNHGSTRCFRSSPYFPNSGKKATFSLQSLNKYLMRLA